jgi:hypothetical protein
MPKKLTKAERDAAAEERQAARLKLRVAVKGKVVIAAIKLLRPELEAAYISGDAPRWLTSLIKKCEHDADIIAGNIGLKAEGKIGTDAHREAFEAAYKAAYSKSLPALLVKALADHDAADPAG